MSYIQLALERLEPRILKKFTFDGPWSEQCKSHCWEWAGAISSTGYGNVAAPELGRYASGKMKTTCAHRYIFMHLVGPIPQEMRLDHLCHNHSCVNPQHLRLATAKTNGEHRRGAQINSKSGVRGVSWCRQYKQWVVRVRGDRFGYFDDLEAAEAVAIICRTIIFTHSDVDKACLEWAWSKLAPHERKYVDKAYYSAAGSIAA